MSAGLKIQGEKETKYKLDLVTEDRYKEEAEVRDVVFIKIHVIMKTS